MSGRVRKEKKVVQRQSCSAGWQCQTWLLNNSVCDQKWQFYACRNTSDLRSNTLCSRELATGKWNFHILKWAYYLLSTVWVGNTSMYRTQVAVLKNTPPSAVATLRYLRVISLSYTFEFTLPCQEGGRMRARDVTDRNGDGTAIQKWQGNKKRQVMQSEHWNTMRSNISHLHITYTYN